MPRLFITSLPPWTENFHRLCSWLTLSTWHSAWHLEDTQRVMRNEIRTIILENASPLPLKALTSLLGILSFSIYIYDNPGSETQRKKSKFGQEKSQRNRVTKGYDKQCSTGSPNFLLLIPLYIPNTYHTPDAVLGYWR